jgi:hypothetical protein
VANKLSLMTVALASAVHSRDYYDPLASGLFFQICGPMNDR